MSAELTINDFYDLVRPRTRDRLQELIRAIETEERRSRGQTGALIQAVLDRGKEEFEQGALEIFEALRRVKASAKLDPDRLEQAAIQELQNFLASIKTVMEAIRRHADDTEPALDAINTRLSQLDKSLTIMVRQLQVGLREEFGSTGDSGTRAYEPTPLARDPANFRPLTESRVPSAFETPSWYAKGLFNAPFGRDHLGEQLRPQLTDQDDQPIYDQNGDPLFAEPTPRISTGSGGAVGTSDGLAVGASSAAAAGIAQAATAPKATDARTSGASGHAPDATILRIVQSTSAILAAEGESIEATARELALKCEWHVERLRGKNDRNTDEDELLEFFKYMAAQLRRLADTIESAVASRGTPEEPILLGTAGVVVEQLRIGLIEVATKHRVHIWEYGAAMAVIPLLTSLLGLSPSEALQLLRDLLFPKK